jgi:hypothetical protein
VTVVERIATQDVTPRELLVAAGTGAVMGMLSYMIIRHIERSIRASVAGVVGAS